MKILYVGRLTKQKDPFTLLKAFRILADSDIPLSLEIIGDGPLKVKMQDFVLRNKLDKTVHFTGWIGKEELRNKYQEAQLLLITSLDEGMSLTMLEAMACGLHIISTPVSGSEIIQEGVNGDFFPYNGSKKLSEKINNFYTTSFVKQKAIPEKQLEEIRKSISWEHYSYAYHKLIEG